MSARRSAGLMDTARIATGGEWDQWADDHAWFVDTVRTEHGRHGVEQLHDAWLNAQTESPRRAARVEGLLVDSTLRELRRELDAATARAEHARGLLEGRIIAQYHAGMPETALADASGLARSTIRAILGK